MSLTATPRLLRALTAEPLAMERATFDAFLAILRRRGLEGISVSGLDLHAELGIASPRDRRQVEGDKAIAVIPIVGAIANRAQSLGVGAQEIAATVRSAAADPRIGGIVLDMETPGGTVGGVPEAAQAVFEARKVKPVFAVSNDLMASAGYWIGAAATRVFASPSSRTGSIGVFMVHEDWSAWLEKEGIAVTEVAAGRFKTEGAPWKPLDDEALAFLNAEVAEAYAWFTRDVARFRGADVKAVREGFGEGRVLSASDARAAGLVDEIGTLEDAIGEMQRLITPPRRSGARASVQAEVVRRRRERGA